MSSIMNLKEVPINSYLLIFEWKSGQKAIYFIHPSNRRFYDRFASAVKNSDEYIGCEINLRYHYHKIFMR